MAPSTCRRCRSPICQRWRWPRHAVLPGQRVSVHHRRNSGSGASAHQPIERAQGEVYKLNSLVQFPGAYAQGRYGFAIGDRSGGDLWLQNEAGVILHLKAKTRRSDAQPWRRCYRDLDDAVVDRVRTPPSILDSRSNHPGETCHEFLRTPCGHPMISTVRRRLLTTW